jgi:hypothetical protein
MMAMLAVTFLALLGLLFDTGLLIGKMSRFFPE